MNIQADTIQRISDGPLIDSAADPTWIRVCDVISGPHPHWSLKRIVLATRVYYLMMDNTATANFFVWNGNKYRPERNTTAKGTSLSQLWRQVELWADQNEYVVQATGEETTTPPQYDENGQTTNGIVTKYEYYTQLLTPTPAVASKTFLQSQAMQVVQAEDAKPELSNRLNVTDTNDPKVKKI